MLTFEYWKMFLRTIQWGSGVFGVFFNITLILLIIYRSPKHLGAYKYLMMYISALEIFYAILESVTEPHTFSHGPAFVLFRYFKHSDIGRQHGFYLLAMYSGSFSLSIALFGVHFIYRYGAADVQFRKRYLAGKKLSLLFFTPLFYGIWWFGNVVTFLRRSPESDNFMRIPLLEGYDSRIEDISYVHVQFYTIDDRGAFRPVWTTFFVIGCSWFMMSSSFFCVVYFGIKCYIKMTRALKKSKMSSYYARSIQQQLFQALALQTLIPGVVMYIPVGIIFLFPMLNIDVGFISSFVTATIAIYPAVDPLPTMFIVDNYRKTLLCGCRGETKGKGKDTEGVVGKLRNKNSATIDS